ncbi:hypothetical protein LR48_Vigan03g106200 [Vigna angularis]|uniref:Uncharacterized protein n=1 Tax=Phaseolus angularis TaxID=3914 RepID=A0A0L9U4G4_PHAAN|nr:hypothetical protein LR48_Vigan03g106200 [Vigna angularis]
MRELLSSPQRPFHPSAEPTWVPECRSAHGAKEQLRFSLGELASRVELSEHVEDILRKFVPPSHEPSSSKEQSSSKEPSTSNESSSSKEPSSSKEGNNN